MMKTRPHLHNDPLLGKRHDAVSNKCDVKSFTQKALSIGFSEPEVNEFERLYGAQIQSGCNGGTM